MLRRLILAASMLSCVAMATSPSKAAARASAKEARHTAPAGGPKRIGKWDDWQAATHVEAGQQVCYAFSRPVKSAPALGGRGDVVLTITERPTGRDVVALAAGFGYPADAEVEMTSDGVSLPFYTAGRSAFARDGRAAVALFIRGRQAQAHSPGPHGKAVVDTFSLRGFSQAYAAIAKACPAK